MKIDQLHYISQQGEGFSHADAIEKALDAGCRWIQLRVKNSTEDLVRVQAEQAKVLCDKYEAKLIVNDYPSIAKEFSAYGVHLGLLDMSISEARQILGEGFIIGGTANTFDDIQLRVNEGADYIGLGPLRFTTTKEKLSPVLGFDGYREVMQQVRQAGFTIPIVAIGSVGIEDVPHLLESGLHGVAVSGTITYAERKKETVEEFYQAFYNINKN